MGDVLFKDGPCDGKHFQIDDQDLIDGTYVCNAFQYRVYMVAPEEWLALPPAAPRPDTVEIFPTEPPDLPDPIKNTSALGGWNQLMHALTVDTPRHLRSASAARRVIRRA